MPVREAVTNTIVPQVEAAPIPTRTVVTRSVAKPATTAATPAVAEQYGNQQNTSGQPAAESAKPAESVSLSPQLSAIARKEQAFRQRELALKQREQDLEATLAKAKNFDELKAKLDAKDFSEAEKLGLNYDDYLEFKLKKANGEDPNAKEFAEIRGEMASMKKAQEEKSEREFEETKSAYRKEIASLVASNPEFSSIKELKNEEAVLQLILDTWEEDGEELTVDQACKDIEDFIVEQGKKFSSLPKLKPAEAERKLPPPRTGTKTLTNNMAPSGEIQKPTTPLHTMSDSERYAEARRRVEARRQQQQGR